MDAETSREGPTGEAALLPSQVAELLTACGVPAGSLGAVAVVVGPGSFTGLRASLAFAHGLSLAAGCPLLGVTQAEALSEAVGPREGRGLWCAFDARSGRIFLSRSDNPADWMAVALEAAPLPDGPILVAGDAAADLARALAARGAAVTATGIARTHLGDVALAALRRMRGERPPLAGLPLYIDPPRALPPRGGLRPAPGGIA
jgi:tRNA threonylcarbamoyladenosine biosynthesis protein TsaB